MRTAPATYISRFFPPLLRHILSRIHTRGRPQCVSHQNEARRGISSEQACSRAAEQPGQYAAEETVTLVGPRGRLNHVRIVGPPRFEDQVELSRTDEIELGINAPLRESGDLSGTPGIDIEGPAGRVTLRRGVICALRHIHMSPAACRLVE